MPITHSGSFSVSSGTAFLCVNGWTINPLVEYYIIEDYAHYPRQLTSVGNFTTDGSTYTIYEYTRVNQPAIVGISTYKQYFSVRESPRSSGTVTLQNHFTEWASLGMKLGTFNYQVVAVEAWTGSGSSTQFVIKEGVHS